MDSGIPYCAVTDFLNLVGIGHGAGGCIYRGYHGDFGQVAIKQFKENDHFYWGSPFEKYKKEIEILINHARHPNIVQLYGILWDGHNQSNHLGYVMEYVPGGSLHDVIHSGNCYDFQQVCRWVQQMALGLQYLHKKSIIHRDIKPANLLVYGEQLKLADFGIARDVAKSITAGVGTLYYMAPEVISSNKYGPEADIYSLGITAWEIFHRQVPYTELGDVSPYSISNHIVDGGRPIVNSNRMSEVISALIQRCWITEASGRPPIKEIIQYFGRQCDYLLTAQTDFPPGGSASHSSYTLAANSSISLIPKLNSLRSLEDRDLTPTIMILRGGSGSENVLIFNRQTSEWIFLPLEVPGLIAATVCLNEEVYLLGLRGSLHKLGEYSNWIPLTEPQVAREGASYLEMDGFIWALAGSQDNRVLNTVERYAPRENTWTDMPPMRYARRNAAAAVYSGRIIICGGYGEYETRQDSVEIFDPESGIWTEMADLPTPLVDLCLVTYRNKLVIVGGDAKPFLQIGGNYVPQYTSAVYELDPLEADGQWQTLSSRRNACSGCCGLVLEEELFAIGGNYQNNARSLVESVEIFNGEGWRVGPRLPYRENGSLSTVLIPQYLADHLRRRTMKH